MTCWLIYVSSPRGPQPQILHDVVGDWPVIDEGIRGRVLARHKLKPGEEELSFFALSTLYPPPSGDAPGPAPKSPTPFPPKPQGGAEAVREVA